MIEAASRRRPRPLRDALMRTAGPPLVALFIRGVRRSVRLRVHGREIVERFARDRQCYVHAFWHAHILMMAYSHVGRRLLVMISQHRDGELTARMVRYFGIAAARGSTTAGGSRALREMLRAVKQGDDLAFTPDGPRGPARIAQPGAVVAAQLTGLPIVPIAIGATRAWYLDTWDRFVIPKPGARVLMVYGEPLFIARDEEIEDGCARLTQALNAVERFAQAHAADRSVGRPL